MSAYRPPVGKLGPTIADPVYVALPSFEPLSGVLPRDWSPAGILHELYRTAPAGDEARRRLAALNVQLSVDEYKAGDDDEHEDCAYLDDVVKALEGERTLSGAARRRVLAALGIET